MTQNGDENCQFGVIGDGWHQISIIYSGYFYSASSSPLQVRGAPDYSIDTVSELTC